MKQIFMEGNNFDEIESLMEDGIELVLSKKNYSISKTINIKKALTITGNGATLVGRNLDIGLVVKGSNVTIRDLSCKGIKSFIEVDPEGSALENVVLDHLNIPLTADMVQGIQIGSSKSNGKMRNVHVQNSIFYIADNSQYNPEEQKDDDNDNKELEALIPINAAAAVGKKGTIEVLKNCTLEDLFIENNIMKGSMRVAIDVMSGVAAEFDLTGFTAGFEHNTIKNLHINHNYVERGCDGPINIVSLYGNSKDTLIDGIEIDGNELGFGIAGIYIFANEPVLSGKGVNGVIKNVKITNNKLCRAVEDVGEPSRGMFLAAARADYYLNTDIENGLLENVEIYNNTINGAGIVITGCYSMLDGVETTQNNITQNVNIHDNHILNADYAFTFDSAQIEGRIYDWNFGFPRHNSRWTEDITDDSEITNKMLGNKIENLSCENNQIDGFRYRVTASGANVRGHGLVKDNKVTGNISFKGNNFGIGENHVKVADLISEDYIHDAGGNEVSKEFLKRI